MLVLERTFDALWLARLEREEALSRVQSAKRRTDCRALHQAQRDAREATTNVVRLEVRR